MKPILASLMLVFAAYAQAQPLPPLPPEPIAKPRGHTSMADAENQVVRLRAARARQATNTTVSASFNYPPQIDLRNQPAVQRVRDSVARAGGVHTPAKTSAVRVRVPSPKQTKSALESAPMRKPKAESAPHDHRGTNRRRAAQAP